MYKNPSFCTTLEVIRASVEKNNKQNMTVACVIAQDGTMLLYDSVEELFSKWFPSEMPDTFKTMMFVEYLSNNMKYFFHVSYEYIPVQLATSEMEARIMMFHEALSCQGITVKPANRVDHSGKAFIKASKLIIDEEKYIESGEKYCLGVMDFLKSCNDNALVDRLDYEYNDVPVYCIKIDDHPKSTPDPLITFKDQNGRPAVIRRKLHDFIDTYAEYMGEDPDFEIFVYPDGTAANMSGGYSTMELDSAISDEDLEKYINVVEPKTKARRAINKLDDNTRFLYRLQVTRTVCIVGSDTVLLPYPITPQQAVFLEGLQEFGYIFFDNASIKVLTSGCNNSAVHNRQKVPLQLSPGFILGGSPYFCSYLQLSPEMKRKVDSVMNVRIEDITQPDKYLFDATHDDRIFVIDSGAEL